MDVSFPALLTDNTKDALPLQWIRFENSYFDTELNLIAITIFYQIPKQNQVELVEVVWENSVKQPLLWCEKQVLDSSLDAYKRDLEWCEAKKYKTLFSRSLSFENIGTTPIEIRDVGGIQSVTLSPGRVGFAKYLNEYRRPQENHQT